MNQWNILFLLLPLLFLLVVIALPIVIGVLVYRDAKARGMDAVVWTLVVVLVPNLIGLIIYLVVCAAQPSLKCTHCGNAVKDSFISCPYCGAQLKYRCPSCGASVESDWQLCAQCGTSLQPDQQPAVARSLTPPTSKKLWIILIVLIAIPMLIIAGVLVLSLLGSAGYDIIRSTRIVEYQTNIILPALLR